MIAATHASIEKFCAQAKVEAFAARKQLLSFGFNDDASAKSSSSLIDSGQGSSSPITHVLDDATGLLVPSHLSCNRDAIVKALRACTNLAEFQFSKYWEDGSNHHPHRYLGDMDEDEPLPFNITSSVAYVLSLAEATGIRLEMIFVSERCPNIRVGISDAVSLVRHKDVFKNLDSFGLHFIEDPSKPSEEV